MTRLRIVPIVEGHGEQAAIRRLLQRIWTEILGGEHIEVLRPIRQPRSRLIDEDGLSAAVNLAALKLKNPSRPDPGAILILIDANGDCPADRGPELLEIARDVRRDMDIFCVLAKVEFETWFVGAAESLTQFIDISGPDDVPDAPEDRGCRKKWIQDRFRSPRRYSETVDQASMTAAMDLNRCRKRCPSFEKLCRDLKSRLGEAK